MVILLILALVVLVSIPIAFFYFLCKWLIKKGYPRFAWGLLIVSLLFIVYSIYDANYPGDDFYRHDFEFNTGLQFPPSGRIIKKEASFPDVHGHYLSTAVIKLSKEDYAEVYQRLGRDTHFAIDTTQYALTFSSDEFLQEFAGKNRDRVQVVLGGTLVKAQMRVGFLRDRETIVFERH